MQSPSLSHAEPASCAASGAIPANPVLPGKRRAAIGLARKPILCLIALLAALGLSPCAWAASITAEEILSEFNLVVLGDLVSTSEVEGRAYVGGTLSGASSNFFIHGDQASPSGHPALIIGGSIEGGAKQVSHGGDAVIGGNLATQLNMNGGGTRYVQGEVTVKQNGPDASTVQAPVFVPDLRAAAESLSRDLATGKADSAVKTQGSRATFEAASGRSGMSIFSIEDGSGFFVGTSELAFDLGEAETIVVNIGGLVIDVAENVLGANRTDIARSVIWNFHEATTIRFGAEFFGTILAPYAGITNSNALNGTVVVGNFVQNGEVHLPEFSATIPELPGSGGPVEVPEPRSSTLFAGGLLGGALILRRKSAGRRG